MTVRTKLLGPIPPGESRTVRIPLRAGAELPDGTASVRVHLEREGGVGTPESTSTAPAKFASVFGEADQRTS